MNKLATAALLALLSGLVHAENEHRELTLAMSGNTAPGYSEQRIIGNTDELLSNMTAKSIEQSMTAMSQDLERMMEEKLAQQVTNHAL